ncbi:hypothetical protein [Arthrobacter sp. ok362]|uniref:hypothetical protein n=1 Tax=Arthrobacter sp. ok362 TaxID=1761745 RepID=UPI000890386D|nr:hypothetical protein [Arthrobacter sp. ok362]SDL41224.1 hypothetical protein SAMN04487913_109100 [Arthrobacter sp. ok362]
MTADARPRTFRDLGQTLVNEWKTVLISVAAGAALIVVMAILANIGDQTVKAFIVQQTEQRVQSYLGKLFVSPAVGGIAAFMAAAVTALVLLAQLRHTKAKDREANWWERYEWITERAFPSKTENNGNAVSEEFARTLLNQLQSEAITHLQEKACANFMSLVVRKENLALESGGAEDQLTDVSVEEPGDQPGGVQADVSVEEPGDQPGGVQADVSVEEPGDQPGGVQADVSVEEPGDQPGGVQADAPVSVPDRAAKSSNTSFDAGAIRAAKNGWASQRAFEALHEYVESTQGKASSSPEAEVFVLRHQIATELTRAGISAALQMNHPDGNADGITIKRGRGRYTIVALPWDKDRALKRVAELTRQGRPVLAISPTWSPSLSESRKLDASTEKVWVKSWNPDAGADDLIRKINAFLKHLERVGLMEKTLPYRAVQD